MTHHLILILLACAAVPLLVDAQRVATVLCGYGTSGVAAPSASFCLANSSDVTYGFTPSGKCVKCGEIPHNMCAFTAVVLIREGFRHCACNRGYFGNHTADGCVACPAMTTTAGYRAPNITRCRLCAQGFTGRPPNCVSCDVRFRTPSTAEYSLTTTSAGIERPCVCPQGFVGQPGNCQRCFGRNIGTSKPGSQVCVCSPDSVGIPPFCQSCGAQGSALNGKCVCRSGTFGKWPACQPCPGIQSDGTSSLDAALLETSAPGDASCRCSNTGLPWQPTRPEPRTGRCVCNRQFGWLPLVKPGAVFSREGSCGTTASIPGSKAMSVDGSAMLGCDVSQGLGVSVASQTNIWGRPTKYCIKCNGPNMVLDRKTSRCLCRPGFGVNINFNGFSPLPLLGNTSQYCIPCTRPEVALRSDGLCGCNSAQQFGSDSLSGCGRCGANSRVDKTGACSCVRGFEFDGEVCKRCRPDQFWDAATQRCTCGLGNSPRFEDFKNNRCACPYGLKEDASQRCTVMSQECQSGMLKIRYWPDAKSANGSFPGAVLKLPSQSTRLALSQLNTTPNLLVLATAARAGQPVALRLEGCICQMKVPEYVVQMSSIGSAVFSSFGQDPDAPSEINQLLPHSKLATGFTAISSLVSPCQRVSAHYFGPKEGLLRLQLAVTTLTV